MDINELIAIFFGVFVGYWAVSRLLSDKGGRNAQPASKPDRPLDSD